MKKDSPYAFVAGIILTLLAWLTVVEVIWPASVPLYLIPMSIFIIIFWVNAWRVMRKQQKTTG